MRANETDKYTLGSVASNHFKHTRVAGKGKVVEVSCGSKVGTRVVQSVQRHDCTSLCDLKREAHLVSN